MYHIKKMKYSIIIPVYNSEASIDKCLESVLIQTFSDFEVIIIDDGSSDNSLNICEEYAEKDDRFRVFHQENRGVSAARNFGLREARGEYLVFLDSDDTISDSYLEEFARYDSDCIIRGYSQYGAYNYEYTPVYALYKNKNGVLDYMNSGFGEYRSRGILSKAIKNQIVRDNNIHFDLNLRYGEDAIFFMQCYFKCNSIEEIPYTGYINYIRENQSANYKLKVREYKYFLDTASAIYNENNVNLETCESWHYLKKTIYDTYNLCLWQSSFKRALIDSTSYVFSSAAKYMPFKSSIIVIRKKLGLLSIPWQILLKVFFCRIFEGK